MANYDHLDVTEATLHRILDSRATREIKIAKLLRLVDEHRVMGWQAAMNQSNVPEARSDG